MKGKIRSMTIEPAKGGFTSQVRKNGPKGEYIEPEMPTVHPSVQHLQAHVAKTFGGGAGPKPAPKLRTKPQKPAGQAQAVNSKLGASIAGGML